MKWKDKLNEWINKKNPLKYPLNIKKQFFWETSKISSFDDLFQEEFIEIDSFFNKEQNYDLYNEYISKSNNKNVTSFYNLSKTSLLIIPMPREGKNYISLKDFIDNASENQQKEFWKYVAKKIISFKKKNNVIYVSTHGLAVPYLHVRLDNSSKYYTGKLK